MEITYRGPLHKMVDTAVGHTLFFQNRPSSKTDEKIESLREYHTYFEKNFGGKELKIETRLEGVTLSGYHLSAKAYRKTREGKAPLSEVLENQQIIDKAPRKLAHPKTVILTMGAGQLFEGFTEYFINYLDRGFDVISFNYNGHGLSEGIPTERGLYENAQDVYLFAVNRLNISENQLVGAGFSLGGATILSLVEVNPSIPLILDRTFSSMENVLTRYAPKGLKWMAKGLSNRYLAFNSIKRIEKAAGPLLIMRADKDEVLPKDCPLKLYERKLQTMRPGQKVTFLDVSGYHNFAVDQAVWVHNPDDQKAFDKALTYLDIIDRI